MFFLIGLFFLSVFSNVFAQNAIQVKFDERVDLLALVGRLSGCREYSMCVDSVYATQVDNYFKDYQNHKALKLFKTARRKYGIAYDAVVAFAMHIQITDNPQQPIIWNPNIKKGSDTSFDCWNSKVAQQFLSALNDFYQESNFHHWYISTDSIRQKYQKEEQISYDVIDFSWYDDFFEKNDKLQREIIISLLVGQNNYGLSWELNDGTYVINPIYGIWKWNDLMVAIHEFCHPYCNPLIDEYWNDISIVAQEVYKENANKLSKMAYGTPKVMMYETLVRASTILHIKEKFPEFYSSQLIDSEKQKGFGLIECCVNSLIKYRENRDQYSTLEEYFPIFLKDISK